MCDRKLQKDSSNYKMYSFSTLLPKLIYTTGSFANSPIHSCHVSIHVTEKDRNITHTSTYLKERKQNISLN